MILGLLPALTSAVATNVAFLLKYRGAVLSRGVDAVEPAVDAHPVHVVSKLRTFGVGDFVPALELT